MNNRETKIFFACFCAIMVLSGFMMIGVLTRFINRHGYKNSANRPEITKLFASNSQTTRKKDKSRSKDKEIKKRNQMRTKVTFPLRKANGYYSSNNRITGKNSYAHITNNQIYLVTKNDKKASLFQIKATRPSYKYSKKLSNGLMLWGIYNKKVETARPKVRGKYGMITLSGNTKQVHLNIKGNYAKSLNRGSGIINLQRNNNKKIQGTINNLMKRTIRK